MDFLQELRWRGLIQDSSEESRFASLKPGDCCYVGLDPTAPSLQLGNLVPLIVSIHLAKAGLAPLILFGGATGAIGDPSGKSLERPLLSEEQISAHVNAQQKKAQEIFTRAGVKVTFVNNLDWTRDVSLIKFLREVGKHFSVNYMLAKEVVKARLEGEGISYTEFSYMLLQAFDFMHLRMHNNCKLQFGGSDQWGNITAGLELIRRKTGLDACAFSHPLSTNSQGKKFGKTEGGALWLDAKLTSPYKLHQFLLNSPDSEVINYLRIFTFLEQARLTELERSLQSNPEHREAQNALADSVCELVHGDSAVQEAKRAAEVLFGGSITGVPEEQLEEIFSEVPSCTLSRQLLKSWDFVTLLTECGAVKSKGEAKRLVQNGGAYLNNERVNSLELKLTETDALKRNLCLVRTGKKSYHLIRIGA